MKFLTKARSDMKFLAKAQRRKGIKIETLRLCAFARNFVVATFHKGRAFRRKTGLLLTFISPTILHERIIGQAPSQRHP